MPRKWISYEMQSLFVGSSGAFSQAQNTGGYISRLDYVQDCSMSFDVQRQQLKQIGSESYASNQSQLAPDVSLNLSYYLNDGWNEDYLGFSITSGSFVKFLGTEFFNPIADKNFYLAIAQDQYNDSAAATSLSNYNIIGVGNAYLNSYNLNIAVGGLATVSCDFVAANATVSTYSANNYLPSVDTAGTGQSASGANLKYGIVLQDSSRSSRYITGFSGQFNGGCPFGKATFAASEAYGSDAIAFGEIFSNIQSFSLGLNFDRKALYGFGSNYPYARKLLKPIMGTVSIETIVDSFAVENLAETFRKEDVSISGYNFNVTFKNQKDVEKFGVRISGAKLDSYQIGSQIGGQTRVSTNWSFPISDSTELLVSGSRPNKSISAVYANESIS
jgi:hypothetical protein